MMIRRLHRVLAGAGVAGLALGLSRQHAHASAASADRPLGGGGSSSGAQLLAKARPVPYGVLGQYSSLAGPVRNAPDPAEAEHPVVVIDPAGLDYIRRGPRGAGGAAGALYSWLGISWHRAFPKDVQAAITQPGDAKFHQYGDKAVIHVVGPNFSLGDPDGDSPWRADPARCSQEEAEAMLAHTYANGQPPPPCHRRRFPSPPWTLQMALR